MERKNKQLTLQIAKLKEVVRRKFRQFKDGGVESEKLLERQYKPIIKELKKVVPKTEDVSMKQEVEAPKTEEEDDEPMDFESDDDDYYIGRRSFKPESVSTPRVETSQLQDALASPLGLQTASTYIAEQFDNPLTRKYMTMFIKDAGGKQRTIDHEYGPRFDKSGQTLMVGDKPIEFDTDGTIIINDTRYRPSEGLYELLFKRMPDNDVYTTDDLNLYKDRAYIDCNKCSQKSVQFSQSN